MLLAPSCWAVQFVEVAEQSGIRFRHYNGQSGEKYFMETLGSGAAFFDYDNDGDVDLYIVNGAALPGCVYEISPINQLYRNNGDGTFTDVTEQAGVGDTGYGFGCAAGDYNNDGYLDLYVTNFRGNVLYRNNGDGTFTDVTEQAGVRDGQWATSCAFGDYDNDGDLDLYVAHFADFDPKDNPWCGLKHKNIRAYCEPNAFKGLSDSLYRNNGDGTFTDVTRKAGLYNPIGRGLGVVFGDYDNDRYLDIYVANDATENFLYHNNGDGTFEDVTFMAGVGLSENGMPENGMGVAFGDYDNDGYLDLTVTNYADQTNTLYHNDRDGFFSDLTFATGVGRESLPWLGWSIHFFDYDGDGYQDIFAANGHVLDNVEEVGQTGTYPQRNLLLRNLGNGSFVDVSDQTGPGMQLIKVSRGVALGDYDNDGDVDIFINNLNQTPELLRNDDDGQNHWLMVQLVGTRSNRFGVGAHVLISTAVGLQVREIQAGSGYLSQSDLRANFGLGPQERVDQLEVRWPGGLVQKWVDVQADQLLTITEGEQTLKAGWGPPMRPEEKR